MVLRYQNGSRMFVCGVCDKHLDIDDNEGGRYNACKEHKAELDARNAEEDRRQQAEKDKDRRRWFENYKEVFDHGLICPHCFKEEVDWWERGFIDEDCSNMDIECDFCEKPFHAILHKEYSFTTTRK